MHTSPIERRKAGDLEVSILGFGSWQFGSKGEEDYWGVEFKQETATTLVQTYAKGGCTYFDTAEAYNEGASEIQLGIALKNLDPDLRKPIIIGTKIPPNHCSERDLRTHLEASLKRLSVDTVDLYMIHWPIDSNSMAHFAGGHVSYGQSDHSAKSDVPDSKKAFEILSQLQKEGKIKHIGVSNFGVQQLTEALSTGVKISINQVVYNLLYRAVEYEILPFCKEHNIGVFAYMPLMQGLLTCKWKSPDEVPQYRARTRHFNGKRPKSRHGEEGVEKETFETLEKIKAISDEYHISLNQIALSWPLQNPAVSCVIVGSTKVEQAQENMTAANFKLPPEVYQKLNEVTNPLKEKLGSNADLWQGNNNSRIK
jgi:aryl-alcohol dehydrogenase-like predicted oxidoreductase